MGIGHAEGKRSLTLNPSLIPSLVIRSYRDLHVWQLGIRLVVEACTVGCHRMSDLG